MVRNSTNKFGEEKKFKSWISNFLFGDCSLMFKESFCKFSKKNLIFKVFFVILWKWKLCTRDARNSPIFWNWTIKNIPNQQKPVVFWKSQKSTKSHHPNQQRPRWFWDARLDPRSLVHLEVQYSFTPKSLASVSLGQIYLQIYIYIYTVYVAEMRESY